MYLMMIALMTAQQPSNSYYAVEIASDSYLDGVNRTVSCASPPAGSLRNAEPCDVDEWEAKIVDEYPRLALAEDQAGAIRVYGMVDKDGRFSDCSANSLGKGWELARLACGKISGSARFTPAINERGEAVESVVSLLINYVLPKWPDNSDIGHKAKPFQHETWLNQINNNYPSINIRPTEGATIDVRFVVGRSGRVDRCEVTKLEGNKVFERAACHSVVRYARFEPALDRNGDPVPSVETMQITYHVE